LKLFSTRKWSSLPLWPMPGEADGYPDTREMASYLAEYERQMGLHVERPINVISVTKTPTAELLISSSCRRQWIAKAVVACTGGNHTRRRPSVPGAEQYQGVQLHSAEYRSPVPFAGKRVVVVGEGNSGAQVLAEVSLSASQVLWVTAKEPQFLPKTMTGKDVFDVAAKALLGALKQVQAHGPSDASSQAMTAAMKNAIPSLNNIIYVDSVRDASERGVLDTYRRPFSSFTTTGVAWDDGTTWEADAVIWCTGYGHDTSMLLPLGVLDQQGRALVHGTRSSVEPRLWLVGYGNWTGVASGSIPGAAHSARATAAQVLSFLGAR
jgi:putative flavoprotein involved in K+ transport